MTKMIHISHNGNKEILFTYAAGYYNSGMILADVLLDDNRYSQLSSLMEGFRIESIKLEEEYNIYPVMFLFRHYLELIIKAMYVYFDINNKKYYDMKVNLLSNHRLSEIWPGLKQKLMEEESDYYGEDSYYFVETLDGIVKKFILIDNDSYRFRYPIDKNNDLYFKRDKEYNLEKIRNDIREFDEIIHEFM